MVVNVAHRGASGNYPENTLIAFQKALEIGVDEIELDLYMTKDDHLIVMHDSTVDRTTDGTGAIAKLTLTEIKALDAGSVFGEQFRGERVPTWEEALDLVQGKVRLNVHLKEGGKTDGHYERKVAQALREFQMVEVSILACSDESVGIFAEIDSRIECRIAHIGRILTESNDGADEPRLALFDQVVEYLKEMLWMIGVITDFRDSLMKAKKIESAQRTICPS